MVAGEVCVDLNWHVHPGVLPSNSSPNRGVRGGGLRWVWFVTRENQASIVHLVFEQSAYSGGCCMPIGDPVIPTLPALQSYWYLPCCRGPEGDGRERLLQPLSHLLTWVSAADLRTVLPLPHPGCCLCTSV